MLYLVSQISLFIFAAAAIGGLIGWLLSRLFIQDDVTSLKFQLNEKIDRIEKSILGSKYQTNQMAVRISNLEKEMDKSKSVSNRIFAVEKNIERSDWSARISDLERQLEKSKTKAYEFAVRLSDHEKMQQRNDWGPRLTQMDKERDYLKMADNELTQRMSDLESKFNAWKSQSQAKMEDVSATEKKKIIERIKKLSSSEQLLADAPTQKPAKVAPAKTKANSGRKAFRVKPVYRIEEIEGVGKSNGDKFRTHNIKNTKDLLSHCYDSKGRRMISKLTGIEYDRVQKWTKIADLMRVKDVASEYSELLQQAGIETVSDLGKAESRKLLEKMDKINNKKKLTRSLPTEKRLKRWIGSAKSMKPIFTNS